MPTDPWMVLFASIQALPFGGSIRFMRGVDGVYVIRDIRTELTHQIDYFADDHWRSTVEGVDFSEIEPWLRVYSPSADTSSSAAPSSASPSGSAS